MRNIVEISDDDEFGSDFDSAAEDDLIGEDNDNLPGPVLSPTQYTPISNTARSNLPTFASSSMPEMCVVSS